MSRVIPIVIGFQINGWNVYRSLRSRGVRPLVFDSEPDSVFWTVRSGTCARLCAQNKKCRMDALTPKCPWCADLVSLLEAEEMAERAAYNEITYVYHCFRC